MKIGKYLSLSTAFFLLVSIAQAVEVTEQKLSVSSGRMLYVLVKTEWEITAKMSGIADEFYGTVDLPSKTFNITASIKRDNFYLTGAYKYANDLMHEGFLESDTFNNANFQGQITSYDTNTGDIKVTGKMKIHGVTKENVEITGKLKRGEAKGYLFTSTFKVNPKDYNMEPPKIKEVDVSIKLELTGN